MRPFARRVVAYVRFVGSNPTLSFECFVSQNGVGSRLSIHISLINLKIVAVATGPRMDA